MALEAFSLSNQEQTNETSDDAVSTRPSYAIRAHSGELTAASCDSREIDDSEVESKIGCEDKATKA
jgi:hypothetical protein